MVSINENIPEILSIYFNVAYIFFFFLGNSADLPALLEKGIGNYSIVGS